MMRPWIFALCLLSASTLFADGTVMRFIDFERAMNEVQLGAKARDELKKEFESKQALLDKKQDELKKLKDTLESQGSVMKPEAAQAKAMEFQKKMGETQQLYASMQQDMAKRQQEAMSGILQKMHVVGDKMAREGGYDAILNKNETTVLFVKPELDLTNEAIRVFNQTYPAPKAKPAKKK